MQVWLTSLNPLSTIVLINLLLTMVDHHTKDTAGVDLVDNSMAFDVERIASKEQKFEVATDLVEGDYSPEYHEYLRLQEQFQGKVLRRLHVSVVSFYFVGFSVELDVPHSGLDRHLRCAAW